VAEVIEESPVVEAAAEAPDEVAEPEPELEQEPEELAEESSVPPANVPYIKGDTHF